MGILRVTRRLLPANAFHADSKINANMRQSPNQEISPVLQENFNDWLKNLVLLSHIMRAICFYKLRECYIIHNLNLLFLSTFFCTPNGEIETNISLIKKKMTNSQPLK